MSHELDDVDRGILYLLQRDARDTTAQEIADMVGVSASTVRNRIDQLEAAGVIRGYQPEIDYEAANLPLRVKFIITAPPTERSGYVDQLLDIKGVVDVAEMLTGTDNLHVEAVGTSTTDVSRISDAVHELGLSIERSDIMKRRRMQPFDHFHYHGDVGEE